MALGISHQNADAPLAVRLLRARRERPGCRAAEQRDEVAPFHSITSSARASSVCGTVMLSALAVLRLITILNSVGACTGRSPGFSPLRMRLMYEVARLNWSTTSMPYESSPPFTAHARYG